MASHDQSQDLPQGAVHLKGFIELHQQRLLIREIAAIIAMAPLFTPTMPRTGKPFSVQMTNCGRLGWVSDKAGGYRYQATHPETNRAWPDLPASLLTLWTAVAQCPLKPEACLVNVYRSGAKLGSHRDEDEQDRSASVVSVSLGDDAVFHVGGAKRGDSKCRVTLKSGDVFILGGPSRLAYHGIDRVAPGTSMLVPGGGRINLTLRRVTIGAV